MKISCTAPVILAGCVTAFAPSASRPSSTFLNAVNGHDVRGARSSYAKPTNYHFNSGEIGSSGDYAPAQNVAYAPYGEVGASVNGHDVRGAFKSYAKPTNYHFVSGEIGSDGSAAPPAVSYTPSGDVGASVSGHDVRGSWSSYAKPTNYHFVSGEIGTDGADHQTLSSVYGSSIGDTVNGHDVRGARSSYAKATNYHFVTGEIGFDGTPRRQVNAASGPYVQQSAFVAHSSTGAGNHDAPTAPAPAATAAEVASALSSGPPKSSGWGIGSWKK